MIENADERRRRKWSIAKRVIRKRLSEKVAFEWRHEGCGGLFKEMKEIQNILGTVNEA